MRTLVALLSLFISSQIIADNVTWILPPEYESIMEFHDGISAVKQDGLWGYVNSAGHLIVPCKHEVVYPFSDGMGVIASADNTLLGIVDIEGHITKINSHLKIDNRFAEYSDGLLLVTDGKKWGYLGKTGSMAISCKYISALPFCESMAGVLYDGYWYYIAPDGATIIKPGFQGKKKAVYWALGFMDGKALIVFNKGLGYIDRNGCALSEKVPKLTPPDEPALYKHPYLPCKEGNLIFDSKGCVVAYTDKDKNRYDMVSRAHTQLPEMSISNVPKSDIIWLTDALAAVKVKEKYGIIKKLDESSVSFSVPSLEIGSVFGLPTHFQCTISNGISSRIDDLIIKINDSLITSLSIDGLSHVSFLAPICKVTDEPSERVDITLSSEQYGLTLSKQLFSLQVIDIPSIKISDITSNVAISKDSVNYPISVTFTNMSDTTAKNVKIMVNGEESSITLPPREKVVKGFRIPVSQKEISVEVKPAKSPIIKMKSHVNVTSIMPPIKADNNQQTTNNEEGTINEK